MLSSKPTKYGSGILLYGDYFDLTAVHETIHTLVKGPPLDENTGNYVLSVAYDLRKAYEGSRERIKLGNFDRRPTFYLGVKFPWPSFLMYLGILRWAAGFHALAKADLSILLRLESCAEESLEEFDSKTGKKAVAWLNNFSGIDDGYLPEVIVKAELRYLSQPKGGISRFKHLPSVLTLMNPLSREYNEFRTSTIQRAKKLHCRPHDLRLESEYPKFKW